MASTVTTARKGRTLKAQFLLDLGRLAKHWHGELPMWEALTQCVGIVLLPAVFAFTAVFVMELVSFEARIVWLVFYAGYGLTLVAIGWWCKGMFALSNQLLSQQRMLAALVAFLLPIPIAWQLMGSWSLAYLRSFDIDIVQVKRHPVQHEGWEKHPVSVIGLPELHRLALTGYLGLGSANAMTRAMDANPDLRLIELDSSGGLVSEANVMVALIQKRDMDTLVRGRCASACTDLFLSGRRRFVGPDARFGFHQSGFDGRKHDTVWAITEYESSIFYRAKGVSQAFADYALDTSYYSSWRPEVLDVKRSGFATHWWSDRPAEYN